MPINFADLPRTDLLTDDVLASPELAAFVNGAIDAQTAASASEMKLKQDNAIAAKAIADQKVADLQGKITELETANPNDSEAVAKLKAQLATSKADYAKEHQAQMDNLTAQLEEANGVTSSVQEELDRERITTLLNSGIAEYNAKNEAYQVENGAESHLIAAGLKDWRKTETGFRAFDGGGDVALPGSNEGFISKAEYIGTLASKPEYKFFFKQPVGGGAGGNGGGATGKSMTRAQFGALPPAEQATAATTHTITD